VGDVARSLAVGEGVAVRGDPDATTLAALAVVRVRALAVAGRPDDGVELARRALAALDGAGTAGAHGALIRMGSVQAHGYAGDIVEAIAVADAAVGMSGGVRAATTRAFWAHDLGQAHLLAGHARTAYRWLREVLAVLPVQGLPATPLLWGLDAAAHAAAVLSATDEADAHVARLEAVLPRNAVAVRGSGPVWAAAARGEVTLARRLARARRATRRPRGAARARHRPARRRAPRRCRRRRRTGRRGTPPRRSPRPSVRGISPPAVRAHARPCWPPSTTRRG
jgi:hypothetical protein